MIATGKYQSFSDPNSRLRREGILVGRGARRQGERRIPVRTHAHFITRTRCLSLNVRLLLVVVAMFLFITGGLAQSGSTSKSTSKTTMTTVTATSTSSSATPSSTDDLEGIPVTGQDNLPTPFDTSIGKTFLTETCPAFFKLFLDDPVFRNCLPLSAMLQNSQSFFEITKKSGFATTRVLDASCSVDFELCRSKMEYYGREIKLPERCGTEFGKKDQLVIQAYAAFLAYPILYKAGCLKSDSGSYCYVDAVTNVTSPDDSHIYYLPLGVKLPGGSRPTCSSCGQETMNIFQESAGNKSLPLFDTYVPAAQQMNIKCGPSYANTTVELLGSGSGYSISRPVTSVLALVAILTAGFLI